MSRLDPLKPGGLTAEQDELYQAIAGGPRATGPQAFELMAADGSLNGPFGVMLQAPHIGAALQELGAVIRYRTAMSARSREIAILMVAAFDSSSFESYAHERVGRVVGLSEDEIEALREGRFQPDDPQESAVATLTASLLARPSAGLDHPAYKQLVDVLGVAGVIEVVTLVGYYRTLALLLAVFQVGAPAS